MKIRLFLFFVMSICFFTGVSSAANPQVTLTVSGGVSGDIVLELYADSAPVTTANFIDYVQSGFYDGLIFHRVISGFMIQGGGYDINHVKKTPGPAIINESSNRLSHLRGTIGMARTYVADSATSEFFINVVDNTFLDYGSFTYDYYTGNPVAHIGYCVFGEVISGMDVVDDIAAVAVDNNVPVVPVIIQSATVTQVVPVCAEKLPGDVDGDCSVNFSDIAELAQNWLECNSITEMCN